MSVEVFMLCLRLRHAAILMRQSQRRHSITVTVISVNGRRTLFSGIGRSTDPVGLVSRGPCPPRLTCATLPCPFAELIPLAGSKPYGLLDTYPNPGFRTRSGLSGEQLRSKLRMVRSFTPPGTEPHAAQTSLDSETFRSPSRRTSR